MADRAENNWVSNMCQEMLKAEDTNCIGVDWRRGSGSIALYVQAANNARLVGAEIAYFIQRLHENLQYPLQNVHIIGHSLGAHAAGYAGSRCPGLRRITGLDPARPYFQDTPEEVHLNALDAMFVDIIHSDTGAIGAGMVRPTGHLDFYPNGGQHMTGCPSKLAFLVNRDILETVACNHFMAFRYYTYSIRHPGAFISYPCDSYKKFTSLTRYFMNMVLCRLAGQTLIYLMNMVLYILLLGS
ncbi:pancreatic lipase-related protein 2-like [Gastrophryne carolinensis]